jgi:hypothetical protein
MKFQNFVALYVLLSCPSTEEEMNFVFRVFAGHTPEVDVET